MVRTASGYVVLWQAAGSVGSTIRGQYLGEDGAPAGAAFISERTLSTGDLLELTTVVDDRPIRFELRVVRSIPAIYGRNRVGCEVTSILEADRHTLTQLSERYQREGSPEQRNPEIAKTLEAARSESTVTRRPARRYHN